MPPPGGPSAAPRACESTSFPRSQRLLTAAANAEPGLEVDQLWRSGAASYSSADASQADGPAAGAGRIDRDDQRTRRSASFGGGRETNGYRRVGAERQRSEGARGDAVGCGGNRRPTAA